MRSTEKKRCQLRPFQTKPDKAKNTLMFAKGGDLFLNAENVFGIYLKVIRMSNGFKTQKKLSDISGISQTTLSRIEGGTQKPRPETLLLLSKSLKSVTYGELMEKAEYLEGLSDEENESIEGYYDEQKVENDAHPAIRFLEKEALKLGMEPDDPLFKEMLKNAFDLLQLARSCGAV